MRRRKTRPVPENFKAMRYGLDKLDKRWLARFYGNYETMNGKLRRFSFNVKINERLKRNRRELAFLIRATVNRFLDSTVPDHDPGEVFSSFLDLHGREWFRVRRIRDYEPGVIYGR